MRSCLEEGGLTSGSFRDLEALVFFSSESRGHYANLILKAAAGGPCEETAFGGAPWVGGGVVCAEGGPKPKGRLMGRALRWHPPVVSDRGRMSCLFPSYQHKTSRE